MTSKQPATVRPTRSLHLLVLALAFAAGLVLPDAVRAAAERPLETAGFVALVSLAGLRSVWLAPDSGIAFSLRTPVGAGLAVVLGPPLTLLVTTLALVSEHELRSRRNPWMIAFNHLQLGLCSYVAALAAARVDWDVPAVLVAVAVYDVLNMLLVATAARLLRRRSVLDALRATVLPFPWFAVSYAVAGLLAILVVVLLRDVGSWAVWLVLVPIGLGWAALRSARQASERAEELAERVRELEVLADLGTSLLGTRDARVVAGLASSTLRDLCGDGRTDVAVDLGGRVPPHLEATPVPGTDARVGLPPGLGLRRSAEASTVLSAVGLALQRLATEDELREAQQAQAALAERILAEGAIARSRVALHVHDDVLPFLAAAQIQADNAATAAGGGNAELTTRLAAAVRDAIAGGIRTLREVLEDLQGQTLLPGDLVGWLRGACERLRIEHALHVDLDIEHFAGGISHPVEILLAESLHGLFANIVRHARASEVTVRLRSAEVGLELSVTDDGIGFDPTQAGDDSHGLALLRQRVALADGRLEVVSAAGKGTTVTVHVPLGLVGGRLALTDQPRMVREELAQGRVLGVGV